MEITAPIDLRGTAVLLDVRIKLESGVLHLTGRIEVHPVLPAPPEEN
jgi:hypothetical protein